MVAFIVVGRDNTNKTVQEVIEKTHLTSLRFRAILCALWVLVIIMYALFMFGF